MAKDDLFNVSLIVNIEKIEGDAAKKFNRAEIDWNNLSYAGLVGIQQIIIDAMIKVHGMSASVMGEKEFRASMALSHPEENNNES
ncbi:MAG: hypothetical protein CMG78_12030 [Marinobacter sp.]|nr:hypothetical protein [Marinobacter sp.]